MSSQFGGVVVLKKVELILLCFSIPPFVTLHFVYKISQKVFELGLCYLADLLRLRGRSSDYL